MLDPAALLARLDAIAAALAELRAEVVAGVPPDNCPKDPSFGNGADCDDTADNVSTFDWLEVSTASSRYNVPCDTLRLWARTGDIGTKQGGRWLICPTRLKQRLEERE